MTSASTAAARYQSPIQRSRGTKNDAIRLHAEGMSGTPREGGGRVVTGLLRACHPQPAAVVTALVGVLALSAGRGWGTLWVLAAIGAGQLGVGWSNDRLDQAADRAAGRTDKPLATGEIGTRQVELAALAAFGAAIPLSLASGVPSALAHFAALGCALAYNAGLKNLPVSALPYAIAFGLVPAIVTLGLTPPRFPAPWALAAGALIGMGGHFTQVLPDIPTDRARGSRGLPQLAGQRAAAVVTALCLLGAVLAVALGPGRPGPVGWAALGLAALGSLAIVAAVVLGHLPLAFRITLGVAAVAVLALVLSGGRLSGPV
jgi:4-hydroxybenzoate polyprenyltransferase